MKLRAMVAGLAMAATLPAFAQETYSLDPGHTKPGFEVRHMGYSLQRGGFEKISGKVTLDKVAKKGSIDVTIDATTVRTWDARLDTIVKGEKYFNVEKFPTLTFKSANLQFDGDKVVGAEGELTMIGVTKPVHLQVADFKCGENPFNKKAMCGAEITANIKRSEWGLTGGIPVAAADDIKIWIPIEAYRDQPAP